MTTLHLLHRYLPGTVYLLGCTQNILKPGTGLSSDASGGGDLSVGPFTKRLRLASSNWPNCLLSLSPTDNGSGASFRLFLNTSKVTGSTQHNICITEQSCHTESSNERNLSTVSPSDLFPLAVHVFTISALCQTHSHSTFNVPTFSRYANGASRWLSATPKERFMLSFYFLSTVLKQYFYF